MMKKLSIIILVALVGLASCTPTPPIKVSQVIDEMSHGKTGNHNRYKIVGMGSNSCTIIFYTDSMYQIGDTIIAK